MINKIRLIRKGKPTSLMDCACEVTKLHKIVANFVKIYDWHDLNFNKPNISDDNNFRSIILKEYINSIKEVDKITVDENYKNSFGNSYSMGLDRMLKKFCVRYNIGYVEQVSPYDALVINNFEDYINKKNEVKELFIQLIKSFNPEHGTVSSDDIAFNKMNFSAGEIWTGWMTFVTKEFGNSKFQGFDIQEIDGYGYLYIIPDEDLDEDKYLSKVKLLYEHMNKS